MNGSSQQLVLATHASRKNNEALRLGCQLVRPQDPRIGFIALRRPDFFPQESYPGLARLWKSTEAREAMKKTAPPA